MFPSLLLGRGTGSLALFSLLVRPPESPAGVVKLDRGTSPRPVPQPEPGRRPACDGTEDGNHGDVSDLGAPAAGASEPDVWLCKLSLTCDDRRHPRVHKGSFGHEFDPVM